MKGSTACEIHFSHDCPFAVPKLETLRILFPQPLYLRLQRLVLRQLALQETTRQTRLGLNPSRGQHIRITQFVVRRAEIADFYLALLNQGAQDVIYCTKAQAKLFGDLALRQVRLVFQQTQQTKACVVVEGLAQTTRTMATAPRQAGTARDLT